MRRTNQPVRAERDPVELLLKRIARRGIAGTLLGGAASLATACSDDGGTHPKEPPFNQDGGVLDATTLLDGSRDGATYDAAWMNSDASVGVVGCGVQGGYALEAKDLHTSQPFDYVATRRTNGTQQSVDAGSETWSASSLFTVLSETGTACATATSNACATKVAENPLELVAPICSQACSELSVVTTKGDDVERWAGPARLKQLLAPIDTIEEVTLLVAAAGYGTPCDTPVFAVAGGFQVLGLRMVSDCGPIVTMGYQLQVSTTGEVTVLSSFEYSRSEGCIGRIPARLKSRHRDLHQSAFGDYLAHCAHLEAASVVAFERLADELAQHGAPPALIDAARSSALDEVRHARVVGLLARSHGGAPSEVEVDALPLRTLEEIALENATEGCVRETYGALVGAYQAEYALDAELSQAMSVIADDEARHAALSHRVHRWAMSRLDAAARARIQQAQRFAIAALRAECGYEPHPELRTQAGLPSALMACAFVDELSRGLWNDAHSFAA